MYIYKWKLPIKYPRVHAWCVCILELKTECNQAFHLKVQGMQEMEWPDNGLLSPVTMLSMAVNGELCACSVRMQASHTLVTSLLYYNDYSANSNTIWSIKLVEEWERSMSSCTTTALMIPGPTYCTCILYRLYLGKKTLLSQDPRVSCDQSGGNARMGWWTRLFYQPITAFSRQKSTSILRQRSQPQLQCRHWISTGHTRHMLRVCLQR